MDAREVTQSEYGKFVKAASHRAPYHWLDGKVPVGTEEFPIHNVDWSDATDYCEWKGKRYSWGDEEPDRTGARFNTPLGPGRGR